MMPGARFCGHSSEADEYPGGSRGRGRTTERRGRGSGECGLQGHFRKCGYGRSNKRYCLRRGCCWMNMDRRGEPGGCFEKGTVTLTFYLIMKKGKTCCNILDNERKFPVTSSRPRVRKPRPGRYRPWSPWPDPGRGPFAPRRDRFG